MDVPDNTFNVNCTFANMADFYNQNEWQTLFIYPVEFNVAAPGLSKMRLVLDESGNWKKEFLVKDQVGTTKALIENIDGMPQVTNRYIYGPYGEPLSQDIALERQGFIGKEKDLESGLADHGVRKYDYISGRFTTTDPLWEKYMGLTPYQYSANNPVGLLDENGKWIDKSNLSSSDLSLFNNNAKQIMKSQSGNDLLNQLNNASYPIRLISTEIIGNEVAFTKPLINDKLNKIEFVEVYFDFKKSSNQLKTQLEELIHVQQCDKAKDKKEWENKVHQEYKTKKYKDRNYEIDAKIKTEEIINDIENFNQFLNDIPRINNHQLPSIK